MKIFLSFAFLATIILSNIYHSGIAKRTSAFFRKMQQKLSNVFNKFGLKLTAASILSSLGLTYHNSSHAYMPTYQKEKEAYYGNIQQKAWGAVATAYIKILAEEEKSLHQTFFELTKTNQSILDQFKKYYFEDQSALWKEIDDEQLQHNVPSSMKAKAIALLEECRINTNNINVMIVKDTAIDSPGQASGSTIFLRQSLVHDNNNIELSALARAIILHELQHILHDDELNNVIRINICLQIPSEEKQELAYSQAMKIKTFQEKRADILAMLAHLECAEATAQSFKTPDSQKIEEIIELMHRQGASTTDMLSALEELFEKFNNLDSDDFLLAELSAHPSSLDRYFYSKLLHKEMSTQKKESIIDGILHDIVKAK